MSKPHASLDTPITPFPQFYLTEQQLGQPKAQASAAQLAELNPYVPVHVLEGDSLTEEAVKRCALCGRVPFFVFVRRCI